MSVAISRWFVVLAAVALLGVPARAENVAKKFRVGLSVGGLNAIDEINSDSANVLTLIDRQSREVVDEFTDPRNDSAAFGSLEIRPGTVATLSAQYAVTKLFVLEGSIGYQKTDVGNIEVQAQFDGVEVPMTQPFAFAEFRVPAGELTRVPLQVTAMVRLRPKSNINPYFGVGLGYSFIGFTPSDEFDQLSLNMDRSQGARMRLGSSFDGTPSLETVESAHDLTGASVTAKDTFEWHGVAGLEWTVRKKLAIYFDFRYIGSSRSLEIGFNGSDSLGLSVPQLVDFNDSPTATQEYGAFLIPQGFGLIDGGSLRFQPDPLDPNTTVPCPAGMESQCRFLPIPDGQLDSGRYYVQGGRVEYSALSYQVGARWTF